MQHFQDPDMFQGKPIQVLDGCPSRVGFLAARRFKGSDWFLAKARREGQYHRSCSVGETGRTARPKHQGYAVGMPDIIKKSEVQKSAEAKVEDFKEDLGPFVVAAETTRMAMAFTDAKTLGFPIIFANDSFLELTGYKREEVLGQNFNFLLAHADDPKTLLQIKDAFCETPPNETAEISYKRSDGKEFWAALFVSPVRDEKGNIVQYFTSLFDLTRHRENEIQSRMLIDELNHRVKNTLATVQSIVWQAMRVETDPTTLRETIQSRLLALSRSHDLLARENWLSSNLKDIIIHALEPFVNSGPTADRIFFDGPDIRFPPKSSLALAIAFNELATNAVKYGSLSGAKGSVRIEWHIDMAAEKPNFVLVWKESGGPTVKPPMRQGFGSRMIERGLTMELGGESKIEYLPEGLVCTLVAPAP
jgi:PAS domain S-box-containing protein